MDCHRNSWIHIGCGLALFLNAAAYAQQEVPAPFIEKLPSITNDEAITEPDYADVAADARKIADGIEERLIEADMEAASGGLASRDTPTGHAKAEEAYLDMKDMIRFCDSAGGGAGAACKFKLEIKMGMNMGNTLGQLNAGMNPGASGTFGMGDAGQSSSQRNFGMFGPDEFGKESSAQSRLLSDRKTKSNAAPELPGTTAGNVDEVASAKKSDASFDATGDARVLEEYRGHIDGYFKKLAEEEAGP